MKDCLLWMGTWGGNFDLIVPCSSYSIFNFLRLFSMDLFTVLRKLFWDIINIMKYNRSSRENKVRYVLKFGIVRKLISQLQFLARFEFMYLL